MTSNQKKRLPDNKEASDDKLKVPLVSKKQPRQSSSTKEAPLYMVPLNTKSSKPFVATLLSSSFSATRGLEVFPAPPPSPPPPPPPVMHPVIQPSCSSTVASANQPVPQASCSSTVASTNPVLSSCASRLISSQSVLNNGKAAPEGMELRIRNEIAEFLKVKLQATNVVQNPSVVKDSTPLVPAQGDVLQVIPRPQEDIPKGMQHSQRDGMQNAKRPRDENREEMQQSQGETVQDMHQPEKEVPGTVQHSQRETLQVVQRPQTASETMHVPKVQDLVQQPHGKDPHENQQLQETQRPRRKSARKMESQQKKQ